MKEKSSGLSLGDLFLVAFVVLKLCGVIDWSWWWVLSPIWISVIIAIFAYVSQEKQNESNISF